jgi:hypothetical protein
LSKYLVVDNNAASRIDRPAPISDSTLAASGIGRRSRLAQPLDDGGVGHAAALAHRLQTVTGAALFQGVDERRHDAGTAGAQRVTDGDGAAVNVGFGQIGYRQPRPARRDDTTAVGVDPRI